MGLKQSIMIKSKFGSKTPGQYIINYTSREDATESLEIQDYITNYTPRYNATETLKQDVSSEYEVEALEKTKTSKQGVMFGSHGLSYSEKTLKESARRTQEATDKGHVPILQVISFEHDYLVEKGIVEPDMEKPEERGGYKTKIDQLKLRQGITDMMNKMHQEMGFSNPEWGGTIHLDTKHVHVHLTTVEKGEPKKKRLKKIRDVESEKQPRMKWNTEDKTSFYTVSKNAYGFIVYERDNEIVAEQESTKQGNPKWYKAEKTTDNYIEVEKGKINEKVKKKMRDSLNRSLSKTKDIKPFVKNITDKRQLTRALTVDTVYYNEKTVEKMKTLIASLPDNQKQWRAKSNAKSMKRSNELANEIISDIWAKNKEAINLEDFESSVEAYAENRQYDEKFDDQYKNKLKKNAYQRLREESINQLYKDIKEKVKDNDKNVAVPKYSIKGSSDEALKNELVDYQNNESKLDDSYSNFVRFEYKQRSYKDRFEKSTYNKNYYQNELNRYDYLDKQGKTSKVSSVVRDYYQNEYNYNKNVSDKYAYLQFGQKSGVSKRRFDEVKGTDLVNLLYDYGPGEDRSVPKEMAQKYVQQTNTRKEAINNTLDYLVETNQIEQYEILRNHRDNIRKEADIATQINEELHIPTPQKNGTSTIEKRRTIDTIQGRRLLKEELRSLQITNREVAKDFEIDKDEKRFKSKKRKQPEKNLDNSTNFAGHNLKLRQKWANEILRYNHLNFEEEQREEEQRQMKQLENIEKAKDSAPEIEL
ncbi:relaxase MobL [Staphylococcus sp. Marseille-Q6910]|uniref:relaxase MobL n=1 Tax=Staphylococcus sp. Marseille-Q6910 TaxID=2937990 RepID=UPI00203E819B|nr:relaxase MobL [Staphylococcus sp. Marseille-Q6910]